MKLLLPFLFYPLLSIAQKELPRFENDTLYTTCGYNIYKGLVLQLGKGTSEAGYFKFVKFHPTLLKTNTYLLQNARIQVSKLKNYKSSGSDENTIRIIGTVTYPDGKKEESDIVMNFERATENFAGLPSELMLPEGFKKRQIERVVPAIVKSNQTDKAAIPDDLKKILIADEIKKLFSLYKEGALTKEEFESQKKKLLEKQ